MNGIWPFFHFSIRCYFRGPQITVLLQSGTQRDSKPWVRVAYHIQLAETLCKERAIKN